MPVYAWKIFLENAIEMVSIILSKRAGEAQIFRNHHHLASSHWTRWKHLAFIIERVSCIHVWRTPFSVVPTKHESWTDGNSLSRKIQMCFCVKCTQVSGNFSLMLIDIPNEISFLNYPYKFWFHCLLTKICVPKFTKSFIFYQKDLSQKIGTGKQNRFSTVPAGWNFDLNRCTCNDKTHSANWQVEDTVYVPIELYSSEL